MATSNTKLYNQILKYQPYDQAEKLDQSVILKFLSNNSDCLTRDNMVAHFTVSAWIINPDKTKVLMIHHNIYNSWAFVGGHVDGDSDLIRAINREIREETGLTKFNLSSSEIYDLAIIAVDSHLKKEKIVNSHLHFNATFLVEANENVHTRPKLDENSGVKWIQINQIDNLISEEKMKAIYRRLIRKMHKK